MSEELNQADTASAPAEVEDQAETQQAAEAAPPATPETPADPLSLVPKKYRNADGTVDMDRFVKGHLALDKMLGKRSIPASSVEDYAYDFGDAFEVDEERTSAFKAEALAKGFTKEQYAFAMEKFAAHLQEQAQAGWTSEKTIAHLKEAWGDSFKENSRAANAAFAVYAPEDADMNDPVWGHPAVVKLLARIGAEVGEDSVSQRKVSSSKGPSMSREQIDEIQRSAKYMSGDPEANKIVTDWYAANFK
jgi:hypothetical protein